MRRTISRSSVPASSGFSARSIPVAPKITE
jgi:hypothetical protein